jgi:hypothetical protein
MPDLLHFYFALIAFLLAKAKNSKNLSIHYLREGKNATFKEKE